jgi:hypothetical protein
MLRGYGVPEAVIVKLTRWDKVRAVKDIFRTYEQDARARGEAVSNLTLRYISTDGNTASQRLHQKKLQAAAIMNSQRLWLAKRAGVDATRRTPRRRSAPRRGVSQENKSDSSNASVSDSDEFDLTTSEEDEPDEEAAADFQGEDSREDLSAQLLKESLAFSTGGGGSEGLAGVRAFELIREARALEQIRSQLSQIDTTSAGGSVSGFDEPQWVQFARSQGVPVKVLGQAGREVAVAQAKVQEAQAALAQAEISGSTMIASSALAAAKEEFARVAAGVTLPLAPAQLEAAGIPPQLRTAPHTSLTHAHSRRVQPDLTSPELTAWMKQVDNETLMKAAGRPPTTALMRRVTRHIQEDGTERVEVVFLKDRLAVERIWLAETFGTDLVSFGRRKGHQRRAATDREAPERLLERERLRRLIWGDDQSVLSQWGLQTWAVAKRKGEYKTVRVQGEDFAVCEQCGLWGHNQSYNMCPRIRDRPSRRGFGASAALSHKMVLDADDELPAGTSYKLSTSRGGLAPAEPDRSDDTGRSRGPGRETSAGEALKRAGVIIPSWRDWWKEQRPRMRELNLGIEKVVVELIKQAPHGAQHVAAYDPDKGTGGRKTLASIRYKAASLVFRDTQSFLQDAADAWIDAHSHALGPERRTLRKSEAVQKVRDVAREFGVLS